MSARARLALPIALFALLAFPLVPGTDGLLGSAAQAAVFTIIAASLVLLTGWVAQISLAHGALVGIGAFGTGWAATALGIGFPLTLPVAMLVGGGTAALLGAVALRVRGLYLAVATLIFSWAASEFLFRQSWLLSYSSVEQQTIGLPGMVFYFNFSSRTTFYYVAWSLALATLFGLANLRDSKTGRALFAIRGSEMAAASLGMAVLRYKVLAFGLSGAIAGIAGSLTMTHDLVVSPDAYDFNASLLFLAIAVVGGLTSLAGAAAAGALFALLDELFFRVDFLNAYLQLVSAALLAAVFLAYPGGLASMGKALAARAGRMRRAYRARLREADARVRAEEVADAALAAAGLDPDLAAIERAAAGKAAGAADTVEIAPVDAGAPAPGERPLWPDADLDGASHATGMDRLLARLARRRGVVSSGHERRVLALDLPDAVDDDQAPSVDAASAAGTPVGTGGSVSPGPDRPSPAEAPDDGSESDDADTEISVPEDTGLAALGESRAEDDEDDEAAEDEAAPTFAELLERVSTMDTPDPAERHTRRPLIEARGVTVRFGGLTAVDDASLSVREGEIVGLIGPNGAGKTTLFNSIAGFNRPTEGRVRLHDQDVTDMGVHERAQLGVARTFQLIQLFPQLTVFDNLLAATHLQNETGFVQHIAVTNAALRAELDARSRVRRVVELLGLEEVADRRIAGLPFGVLRLVEVARALVGGAPVIMLDEPASGLDERETDRFVDLLRVVRGFGATLLLIEHDMRMVTAVTDYIYVIDRGRLIAEGSPADIQANPEVIAAYLGQPADDAAAEPAEVMG